MKYSILTYRIIAVISFAILSAVQVFLIFNTYQLENERYRFAEKSSINEYYSKIITNDKLFPGGQHIIDTLLNRNIPRLEELYKHNWALFETEKQKYVTVSSPYFGSMRPLKLFLQIINVKKRLRIT